MTNYVRKMNDICEKVKEIRIDLADIAEVTDTYEWSNEMKYFNADLSSLQTTSFHLLSDVNDFIIGYEEELNKISDEEV